MELSELTPLGYQASSCGYCATDGERTPDSGASYYASTSQLTVKCYQRLVDRGWRRSGTLLYKQDVRRSCCPHYTIRLPVDSFVPTKDQRQAVNRWNRHVLGDAYVKDAAKFHPKSKEQKAKERHTFDLAQAVHESEWSNAKVPPEPAHKFEVTLEHDTFTEEKFKLYENYQHTVHHEPLSEISRKGFRRFLCQSPLQRASHTSLDQEQQLGSFHQCYRLDGRLIAMAVLDLLPHCVSGVYFMYHDDFAKWSFGKISALREATLALEGGYQYYYMGFYIHSCVKMRYKGDYKPQHVLDPESHEWHCLDGEYKQLLDHQKYVSLSRLQRERSQHDSTTMADVGQETATDCLAEDVAYGSVADASGAVQDGASLFDLAMPGVLTIEDLHRQVDLDAIKLGIRGHIVQLQAIAALNPGNPNDPRSLQGLVAELAACVGPDVAKDIVVKVG